MNMDSLNVCKLACEEVYVPDDFNNKRAINKVPELHSNNTAK